jgi:hypothetical protein
MRSPLGPVRDHVGAMWGAPTIVNVAVPRFSSPWVRLINGLRISWTRVVCCRIPARYFRGNRFGRRPISCRGSRG